MRLLLDTHVLLWLLVDPNRFEPKVLCILEDPEHEVLFSVASVWEIAIKAALGRADFRVSPEQIVQAARDSGLVELPIGSLAAMKVAKLPHHHRDPFDRLLIAQAMTEPAMFYTADATLSVYSELVVWIGEG